MTQKVCILASYAESLLNFRGPLLDALQARGYEIVASAPACGRTQNRLEQLRIRFVPLPLERTSIDPLADLRYLTAVTRLLRREKPLATIAYTAKPVIWGSLAARLAGVPKRCAMITGLGSIMLDEASARSMRTTLMQALYRISLGACQRVAFQNPDDESEFVRKGLTVRHKAFRVNGSGVQLDRFAPTPLPDEPTFLLIGRLLADKGIREYAAAARLVKRRYPVARFRLAGWFDSNPSTLSRSEIDDWVRDGTIEFVGRLEDVRAEIAAARIYVLPSYREGTPRTVLEAMAMARPVITTDVPGCRETVQNELNGLLVPARDVERLAAAMERFIVDPQMAVSMGQCGRQLAVSKFDATVVANDVLNGFGL